MSLGRCDSVSREEAVEFVKDRTEVSIGPLNRKKKRGKGKEKGTRHQEIREGKS